MHGEKRSGENEKFHRLRVGRRNYSTVLLFFYIDDYDYRKHKVTSRVSINQQHAFA